MNESSPSPQRPSGLKQLILEWIKGNSEISLIVASRLPLDATKLSRQLLRCEDQASMHNRQPESLNVYICMGAKNSVQPAVPIQPDFAQVKRLEQCSTLRVKSGRSHEPKMFKKFAFT